MKKINGLDFEFDELELETQQTVLILGIVGIVSNIALIILLILCVALFLWTSKFTIFLVSVQIIFFATSLIMRNSYKHKAVKQILGELSK